MGGLAVEGVRQCDMNDTTTLVFTRTGQWNKGKNTTDLSTLTLCPGGMSFGVRLATRGVLVVGFSRGPQGGTSPAEEAGVAMGDVILAVNGRELNSAAEFIAAIEASGGNPVSLRLVRQGETLTLPVTPLKDKEQGSYKAGLWVRDSTAGIGTVTMYDPESGCFVGLGHGICDSDTGIVMPMRTGEVYPVSVVSVRKGQAGAPGELKGFFGSASCGSLSENTACGVSGRLSDPEALMPGTVPEALPLAEREEVKVGEASILCTLTDNRVEEYDIAIRKISDADGETKNFVIEVTDPRLLTETGGIVQGMSGSPILQNGKIVGAVTHVMVNDPTKGYGIFIDNMVALLP